MSAILKFLRGREIGVNSPKYLLEILEITSLHMQYSDLNAIQRATYLKSLTLKSKCLLLKCHSIDDAVKLNTAFVKTFSCLTFIERISIEKTTYFWPAEILEILNCCTQLRFFAFSPKWLKPNGWIAWTDIHTAFYAKVSWGEDFHALISRITSEYIAERFIQMYDEAPMWALSDVTSDSESGSESDIN